MTPSDPEYERLKKRRLLPVLNAQATTTDAFVLEGDAVKPSAESVDLDTLHERIVDALRTVHDPEIPLNLYDLGLIYDVVLEPPGDAHLKMTLTAPGCPVAGTLIQEVHEKIRRVSGIHHVKTELVWDPPWTRDRMSEAAKLELGLL